MRIPTIEVRRPDGKLIRINKSDRLGFAKMGCDMDPHNQRKTSGGEKQAELTRPQAEAGEKAGIDGESVSTDKVPTEKAELLKPKTVKLEKPVKVEPPILATEDLSDMIVN